MRRILAFLLAVLVAWAGSGACSESNECDFFVDPATGACVACVKDADCGTARSPICSVAHVCVCNDDADCASSKAGRACVFGECGCNAQADCNAVRPSCVGNLCGFCGTDADCESNTHCDTTSGACAP